MINWTAARRSRRPLAELVERALTNVPTLFGMVSDKYTNEHNLRPWATIAERFGSRLEVLLLAEWEPADRLADGTPLLRRLGLAAEAQPRLLTDADPLVRTAMVLRQKQPVALIDLFFEERGRTTLDGKPEPRAAEMAEREERAMRQLQDLLGRIPPPPPPPPRALQPGEHDFSPQGLCRACGLGRATLLPCTGKAVAARDEGPKRDRFELIELD